MTEYVIYGLCGGVKRRVTLQRYTHTVGIQERKVGPQRGRAAAEHERQRRGLMDGFHFGAFTGSNDE